MAKLIGFQLTNKNGTNITGDDDDPMEMASFEVISPQRLFEVLEAMPENHGLLLMPIYEGDIEEPTVIGAP